MKFRRLIILLIVATILIGFFTKPTKDDFIKFIQPTVNRMHIPPVVEYQDKFLYARIIATYVDAANPVKSDGKIVAPGRQEVYMGLFGRYWKIDQ